MQRQSVLGLIVLAAVGGIAYILVSSPSGQAPIETLAQERTRASASPTAACESRVPTKAERGYAGFHARCLPPGFQVFKVHPPMDYDGPQAVYSIDYRADPSKRRGINVETNTTTADAFARGGGFFEPPFWERSEEQVRGHQTYVDSGDAAFTVGWYESDQIAVLVGGLRVDRGTVMAVARDLRRPS